MDDICTAKDSLSFFDLAFSDLRKQARHLENEIDAKLVAFNKLGVNAGSVHSSSDTVPLLDEEHVFENMATEIESLVDKVSLGIFVTCSVL